jgi:glycosyltransferase involved in cell wall biosynthesis
VRIAFCITDLDPGGAERALVQLVIRLDSSRWQPAVFCLSGEGALAHDLRAAGISVECLGAQRRTDIAVVWRLARALRQFQPEIVQTYLFHANLAGRIASRLAGVKRVVSGIRVAEQRSRIPLWLDRWTNWLVRTNICVSQAVAEFSISRARLAPEKIVVIPNGVDVSKFANATAADLSSFGIPPGSQVLLTIGRLDRQKDLPTLLEAAALVVPKHRHAHFLLVGEGPERPQIEDTIRDRELGGRVHLAGWRADIPEILAAGCALVLSSRWEGMPNVVLEAMAAGLPVVATQVEGISELVINGHTGLVAPRQSPRDLAAAIQKILMDPVAAKVLGTAGQDRARAEFSWETMVAKYERIYESL